MHIKAISLWRCIGDNMHAYKGWGSKRSGASAFRHFRINDAGVEVPKTVEMNALKCRTLGMDIHGPQLL